MAASTRNRRRSTPKSRKPKAKKKAPKPKAPSLRTSERTTYKRCLWLWEQNYVEKRKPIEERPALRFGTLVHAALEARYPKGVRRGPKPAETFEKLYLADQKEQEVKWGMRVDDEWTEALHLGVSMLEMFVEEYGKDEEWEVIQSEMTFKTPVKDPETGRVLFYYVGTIDNVLRNRMDQSVFFNDWKTTINDPVKEARGKGVLDEQATAYWTWGADFLIAKKILKPRDIRNLNGMLYTFLRKANRDHRPQDAKTGAYLNQDGSISKKQPLPYFHREVVYRSEAEREMARARVLHEFTEMSLRRQGELPVYKTPETGQMGHCGYCPVRDYCELHEMGADWDELRRLTTTTWDPYAAHEIQEEGKRR